LERSTTAGSDFLARCSVTLVLVSGADAGTEFPLASEATIVGRGPGADLSFPDDAMSRRHAVFEVQAKSFRVRDLGSTNGTLVNGTPIAVADLTHGDRVKIGEHVFQYVVDDTPRGPRTFSLCDDEGSTTGSAR
jgi:pSer/pThr/pTyr-binding forkhead associated (FHA) protein